MKVWTRCMWNKSSLLYTNAVIIGICGSSVWNLFRVTFLAPRISRWLLDFRNLCIPVLEYLREYEIFVNSLLQVLN